MDSLKIIIAVTALVGCGTSERKQRPESPACARTPGDTFANLAGVTIDDRGATPEDKALYLGELDAARSEFVAVLRERDIAIVLNGGAITDFAEFADLKGQTPRGYEGTGMTWDDVSGTASESAVYLGATALGGGDLSKAIHEATHAIDRQLHISENTQALKDLYTADLAVKGSGAYRMNHIEEYLAVGVDEYLCNADSKRGLQLEFPALFDYLDQTFFAKLTQ